MIWQKSRWFAGVLLLLLLLLFWAARAGLAHASGAAALALAVVEVLCLLLMAVVGGRILRLPLSRRVARLALAAAAAGLTLIGAELVLAALQRQGPAELKPRLPPELERRFLDEEGERRRGRPRWAWDHHWHGVLHAHNEEGFRTRELRPKEPGVMRVVVLGDSLVYGQGIAAEHRFSDLLEARLKRRYRLEVLNLGLRGHESEDVVQVARRHLPSLEPDLVLYGHCFNDFLPSGRGQYANNLRWQVPLPKVEKEALAERTLLGRLVARRYDGLLRAAGIRRTFYGDILADFAGYQERFTADMKDLAGLVRDLGLPPVVALVLTQNPKNPLTPRLQGVAEERMREAGLTVLPATYVDDYARRRTAPLVISQWDGHPNEEANEVYAEAFLRYFKSPPGRHLLAPYERGERVP